VKLAQIEVDLDDWVISTSYNAVYSFYSLAFWTDDLAISVGLTSFLGFGWGITLGIYFRPFRHRLRQKSSELESMSSTHATLSSGTWMVYSVKKFIVIKVLLSWESVATISSTILNINSHVLIELVIRIPSKITLCPGSNLYCAVSLL